MEFTAQEERLDQAIESEMDRHDIEYVVQVLVDGEVVAERSDPELDVVISQEDYLNHKVDEYMRDIVEASDDRF